MDDLDDRDDFETIEHNNYRKIENKLTKVGYADGVADGRESVFQESFDQGYCDGLKTGLWLGKVKSFYLNMGSKGLNEDLIVEKQTFEDQKIPPTTDKEHYQFLKYKELTLQEISQKQEAYVSSLKDDFRQRFPNTMNLLGD